MREWGAGDGEPAAEPSHTWKKPAEHKRVQGLGFGVSGLRFRV